MARKTRNAATIPVPGDALLEDVKLVFRNFSGKGGEFNREGDRNFHMVLPLDVAHQMKKDGWNVKIKDPREEGDDPFCHIAVKVRYGGLRDPQIYMVTSRGKTLLDERSVSLLDFPQIEKADVFIHASHFKNAMGDEFITAYAQKMYVTIVEDELDKKYAGVEDTAMSAIELENPTEFDESFGR